MTPICTANGISHKWNAGLNANRPSLDLTLSFTLSPHSALTHSPIGVDLSVNTNNGKSLPFSLFFTRNNLYAFGIYHHHLMYLFSFLIGIVANLYICTIYYFSSTAKYSKIKSFFQKLFCNVLPHNIYFILYFLKRFF